MQIFDRERLGEEGVVARFDVAVQGRGDDRHHPRFIDEGEVEVIAEMWVLKAEGAFSVDELPVVLHRLSLLPKIFMN